MDYRFPDGGVAWVQVAVENHSIEIEECGLQKLQGRMIFVLLRIMLIVHIVGIRPVDKKLLYLIKSLGKTDFSN